MYNDNIPGLNIKDDIINQESLAQVMLDPGLPEQKIYNQIPEVESIVSMLVDNIYNDETYQKYLSNLEKSSEIERKKSEIIKKTFTDIRVFNTNAEPLFLAKDIGILMGISHIKEMIKKYDDNEKVLGYLKSSDGKIKRVFFLTKYGVYRTLLTSRTKLAKVFRNFIYKLIDYMVYFENDKLKLLLDEYKHKNPDLIKEANQELNENLQKYKYLYELEKQDKLVWELKTYEEHQKLLCVENEKNDLDIINTYNEMLIDKLYKDTQDNKIKLNILKCKSQEECFTSNNLDELQFLKKKFLKCIYIYVIHPDYLHKLIQMPENPKDEPNEEPNDNSKKNRKKSKKELPKEICNDIINEKSNIAGYKKNINHMISYLEYIDPDQEINLSDVIEHDEILYYMLSFTKITNAKKLKYFILAGHDFIVDKNKLTLVLDTLKKECINYNIASNEIIFKTDMNNIRSIINDILLQE